MTIEYKDLNKTEKIHWFEVIALLVVGAILSLGSLLALYLLVRAGLEIVFGIKI